MGKAPAFDLNAPFETLEFDPIAYTREKATQLGLDPDLAVSVGQTESGWNLKARSPKGAYGPFQLTAGTARELGVNRYDPRENIDGGLTYFKQQLDDFGDPTLAAAAYNAGPGAVRKHGGVPPFAETQEYVRKVLGPKAPPPFDPNAPAEVAPPAFDPKKPFDVVQAPSESAQPASRSSEPVTAERPNAPEAHPLKGALARLAEKVKSAGATFDADRKERTTAAIEAMRGARSVSTDAEGRMNDPTEGLQDLIGGIGGAFSYAYAPIGAAIDTAMGRPLEKVLKDAPHGKLGPIEYDARFGKNFLGDAVGQIGGQMVGGPKAGEIAAAERIPGPAELVGRDAASRVGKGFREAVFGEQLPKLAPEEAVSPGVGKFVDAKTSSPLSKGQEAAYEQMRASGELDPTAQPGSRNFPRAQRAPEDLPPPGEWFVDTTGQLKQSPPISPEAPRVAPGLAQEPVEAPSGVMPHETPEAAPTALPEPPAFDPAQAFETVPAFDDAAPFGMADDFPGDRPDVKSPPVDEVAAAHRNVETIQKQLEEERAAAEAERAIVNTRGQGRQYHGARGPITKLEEGYYNPDNIYGGIETFYTTDAADVAKGYGRKKPNQAMYEVTEREPVKFYDMEQPVTPEQAKAWGIDDDDLLGLAYDEASHSDNQPNLREIMDEARGLSRGEGLSKDEVQERFDMVYYNLQKEGYGGVQHLGGLKTGHEPHTVKIYLRPHEQIDLKQVDVPREPLAADKAKYFADFETGLASAKAKAAEVEARSKQPPKPPEVDLTDRALDLIRGGKDVRQKRGQSLVDALSAEGGVRNEGGELSAFDPRAYGQRGGRLMRQNGGMSLDDAALWAQERGYIGKPVEAGERVSPQELLDALRRDLDGERVYAREDPAGAELEQHADDLEQMLHELGIDAHQATNAEIKKALNEYFSAPAEHRDNIYGVRTPKSPDQLELPGVDGSTDTKASILLELQRRSAKRAAEPMEAGGLFDEVRKGEQGLFDDKPLGLRTTPEVPREHVGRLEQRYAAATTRPGLREAPRPTAIPRLDAAKPEPLPREAARVQDMVGRLQRAMDVTHRQGRMTLKGKDVLGEYNPASGVVRTRNMGVMDETAHEYFHDLDFRNLPTLRKTVDAHASELSALDYEPPAPDGSRRAAAKAEGFAEFGRWYVTNPEHAQKVAPNFYQAFESAMGKDRPKMLKAIKAVQADYANYQKAPSADRLAHAVVSTADKGPVKTLLGRVKQDGPGKVFSDWAHGLYFAGQDKLHGLTRWEQGIQRVYHQNTGKALELEGKDSPQQLARLMSNAAGDGFADLTEGVRMPGQIKGEGPKLPEVLAKAYKGDWGETNRRQFSAYLIARRLVNEWDRFAAGKIPKEPHRTTREDALQAIADFEKAHPEWKALSDQINEHQALVLKKSREAGLITKEAYEDAQKEHPFYVPLNRDLSEKARVSSGAKPGDGATAGGMDRFVGSTRDFIDPIESIMRRSMLQSAVIKANDVKVAMAAAAKKAGRGAGFFAEEVPNSEIKAINVAADQALAATAKEMGVDIEDVREAMLAADLQLEPGAKLQLFKAEATSARGEPMVFYWQDGKRHALRLGDDSIGKQVYEALSDLGKPASNLFLNILAPPARLLQTGVTTHPAYFLANTMRDAIASVANTSWGVNPKPLFTMGRGIVDDLAHTENAAMYDRFGRVRGGAAMASQAEAQFRREVGALRKRNIIIERFSPITRKPGQLPRINLGAIAHLAELSEAGTRLGVYRLAMKRALKEGLDPESAAIRASNEAADILAFDRHGARMFTAHKAVTFLNAWQQGMDKFVRSATAPTAVKKMIRGEALTQADVRALKTAGGKWWPVFASTGVVGLLQSIAYHDDPEYQEISPYLRANHWFFRPEDIGLTAAFPDWAGKWVAIPKPFELAAPSNVVERMFEATVDHDEQAVDRMWKGLGQLLLPPSGVPLLATHEQVLKNRDYNGKPIIPEHKMGAGDPELKTNSYTSAFSKGLAHELGDATEALTGKRKTFSPAVADHWIQSLMGSWGRSFLSESNRVDAALKGKPQPHLGPDEGLVSARFVRDVTRSSQSQADFWKKVGKDEGEYEGAFNDVSQVYKDDPADALKRLSKMPEDVRDYTLAKMFGSLALPNVPGGASKLHPMVRARDFTSVISDIRQKVRDGKLTTPTRAMPLTADQQRDADDALSHLAMAEMRDALIASGAKGYGNKAAISTDEDREKLRAIDPGLIEALDGEAAARNIPDRDTVTRAWPQLQLRLRAASDAQLQAAMTHKSTRTKSGKYDALSRMNEALLAQ